MSSFDYNAPADLFPARSRSGHRPVGYRRFNTAAEAIRFAIEQMPSEFLDGTVMESRDERADGFRIKALYDSKDYPLLRKWRRVDLRNASGADLTFATRQPRAREANVKSKAPPAPNTC